MKALDLVVSDNIFFPYISLCQTCDPMVKPLSPQDHMCLDVTKPVFGGGGGGGAATKRDSNQSPQLQRLARKLKIRLKQALISYFPISE